MKIIMKTALKPSDVELINKTNCDGVEIQLLEQKNDFSLLEKINKRIVTLHIDLPQDIDDTESYEGEYRLDIYYWVMEQYDYLCKVCEYAQKYGSAIILHGFVDSFVAQEPEEFKNRIKEICKNYPEVKFCIENSGFVSHSEREKSGNIISTHSIPPYCKKMNEFIDEERFFPLLDITHYFQEYATEIEITNKYSLVETIECYGSNFQCIHFNYGYGDCITNERHSKTFKKNDKLLSNLFEAIKKIENREIYLITEIVEEDYINRPEMLEFVDLLMKKKSAS